MPSANEKQFQLVGGGVPVNQLFDFEESYMQTPPQPGDVPQITDASGQVVQAAQTHAQRGGYGGANTDFSNQFLLLGGPWQQLAAANRRRKYLLIQNQHATNSVQVYFGAQPPVNINQNFGPVIGPGMSYELWFAVPGNVVWGTNAVGAVGFSPCNVVQG